MATPAATSYSSSKELYSEVIKHWSAITKEAPKDGARMRAPKKEVESAFSAYQNAMSGVMPFVLLGGERMREDKHLVQNFGTLASDTPQYNFEKIRGLFEGLGLKGKDLSQQTREHLSKGAIINDSNWSILRNDLFILGAIHAQKEFHIAYCGMKPEDKGIPNEDLLWDKKERRPRALGREILMLRHAGFTPYYGRIGKKYGVAFLPPSDPIYHRYSDVREQIKNSQFADIVSYLSKMAPIPPTLQAQLLAKAARDNPSPTSSDASDKENKYASN